MLFRSGTFVNAADSQMAAEARRKAIEDDLSLVISKAFTVGLSEEELKEIFEIILEDYDDTDKRTEKEV